MTFHLEQQRYSAVIGSEGQVFLRGVLDESSDLKQTLDLINERHKLAPDAPIHLDFLHLVSGSWNGFLSLDRMLSRLNFDYVLRHVSFELFRYVALLPTLRKARLGEIELAVVSTGIMNRRVQVNGEAAVAMSASGRFVSIGGQQVIGRHSFIFGDRVAGKLKTAGKTEFDVWYDYVSFTSITLALAEDLAKSIAMSVIRLSSELAAEYASQATGMTIIKKSDKSVWALEAEGEARILTDHARDSESIYGRIILGIKKNVGFAEAIQNALHKAEGDERQPIIDAVQGFREIRTSLLEIVQLIESGGTETFALLISVPGKKLFDDAYLAAAAPNAEDLAAIREAFSIMDPLSEEDWEETRLAIFERTKDIEQLVSSLIVLTQGFDLLRQIIEHRIAEIVEVEAYLDRGAPMDQFEAFKKLLHERIKRKLVTDQEKLSVDAFIPEVLEESKDLASKPGDVLLF